ncbi:hypothetical protein N8I77_004721 [Diaporthe amygdali]|uniref:Uncharacterized protein n=1 Tax=Phomopsis amygdali TaxID=1214568 RepID=A0AAD9W7B1_PHOAM|nr:hypothetical protein N8I77_004721 [Diaporthe amygdali]
MTTQFYTNPLCTQHARRPILAPEMCPACQRVIHGRAVLITEWEHRWMHERGVCGCEVQFPDLIRPRVVSRSRPGQTIGRNGQMKNNTHGSKNNKPTSVSLPKTNGSGMAGTKGIPAYYQERSTKKGEDKPEVDVRIPSLYGVEWVDEHRQLHKDGSCKCAGDFSFYKTREPYPAVPSTSALINNVPEQVVRTEAIQKTSQGESHRNFQNSASSHYSKPQNPSHLGLSFPKTLHNSHSQLLPHHQVDTLTQQSTLNETASLNQAQHHISTFPHTQDNFIASPKFPPLVVNSSWPHTPQRSPGAIYEVDLTKSTNKLYNLACNEGANITGLADFQSIEFPKPKSILPLVGLPIGAGPEGPPSLSHVGSFEDCVLHTKGLIACMGDGPCLLMAKSKSFACLHELKAGCESLGQQATAQERTQSVCSSAESSDDDGDSTFEDDQLYLS